MLLDPSKVPSAARAVIIINNLERHVIDGAELLSPWT